MSSRSAVRAASLVLAVVLAALPSAEARAQWGGGGSLFTENGIEIAVDGRVTTLYAMLNALGYDEETVRGPEPLARPGFTEARAKARSSLGRPGPALRAFEKVVQANAVPVRVYLDAVLSLGPAPRFEPPAKASKLAKAMAEPMRSWFNEEGGAAIDRSVSDLTKATQKQLLGPTNDLAAKLTKLIRLGDEEEQLLDDTGPLGRVFLIVNPLDAHGTLHRIKQGDATYVVTGPLRDKADETAAVHAVALSYVRTLVEREVRKAAKPGTIAELHKGLAASSKGGVVDAPPAFAAELVACGLARTLVAPTACASSPLATDPSTKGAVELMTTRTKAWIDDTMLLQEAAPGLLAPEGAPPPEPAPPAPAPTAPPPAAPAAPPAPPAKR